MDYHYHKYLRSKEWGKIRDEVLELRGRKCERCGSKRRLHVHHLTYERLFKEEPGDLEVVCNACHLKIHNLNHKGKKIQPKKPHENKKMKRARLRQEAKDKKIRASMRSSRRQQMWYLKYY